MTIDPGIIAADLEHGTRGIPPSASDKAAAALLKTIVVPLHDAWLQAKPPCPHQPPPLWGHDAIGHGVWVCPDCPDGVLPFDKWTAGLVALWTLAGVVERLLTDELRVQE